MSEYFSNFVPTLIAATDAEIFTDPTLGGKLVIDRAGGLVVSYAPFEHVQRGARVVIVGITPGAHQASNALAAARRELLSGASPASALVAAKTFASFSGPMRTNLVSMLDHVGLNEWLGLPSTERLWAERETLAHFTSALRYPVFVGGKNYSGQPSMVTTPLLRRLIDECLRAEAQALPGAVWVPLGPKAMQGIELLVRMQAIRADRVLEGLPHPSGANAERIAYFLGRKPRGALSSKTEPTSLDAARERIAARVAALS